MSFEKIKADEQRAERRAGHETETEGRLTVAGKC